MNPPEGFVIKQEVIPENSDDEPLVVASPYANDSDEEVVQEVGEVVPGAEYAASNTSSPGASSRVMTMSPPERFVIKHEVIYENTGDEPLVVASRYADDSDEEIAQEFGEVVPGAEDAASKASATRAKNRVPCPTCDKVLANRTTLLKHIRIHTDERPYPCPLCQRRFRQKEHRDKHTRIHSMGNEFECLECAMTFGRRHFLEKHMRTVHNVDLITGLEQRAIRLGGATERPEPEVQVEADTTDASTGAPPTESPTVHRCDVCRKEFHQRYNLRRHVRSQHSKESTECHFCGKVFQKMSGLKTHEMTHTGTRPYVCSLCGRTFTQKHHMVRHQLVHMPKFNIVCPVCHRGFRYASNFFEHVAIHDAPNQQPDGQAKPEVQEEESDEEMEAQQHEDGVGSPKQGNKTPDQFEVVPFSKDASVSNVWVEVTPTPPLLREKHVPIEDSDAACMFCAKVIIDPCELTEHLLEHCNELSGNIVGADQNKKEDEVDEILGL